MGRHQIFSRGKDFGTRLEMVDTANSQRHWLVSLSRVCTPVCDPTLVSGKMGDRPTDSVLRDIKPHNFVLTPTSHLLLVDYGSAAPLLPPSPSGVQLIPKEHCLVPCGTCDYISPEVLQCHEAALVALELEDNQPSLKESANTDEDEGAYGRETDWWSFGAMVYEMAFGVAPFFANDVGHTYMKIVEHRVSLWER